MCFHVEKIIIQALPYDPFEVLSSTCWWNWVFLFVLVVLQEVCFVVVCCFGLFINLGVSELLCVGQIIQRFVAGQTMSRYSLAIDAWIREAEEASRLVEDLEIKFKNNNSEQWIHRDSSSVLSKLLEIGGKLDRLESLLRNPPSKPILYIPSLSLSHLVCFYFCFICVLLFCTIMMVYGCFISIQVDGHCN